jgi:hypothetical protein
MGGYNPDDDPIDSPELLGFQLDPKNQLAPAKKGGGQKIAANPSFVEDAVIEALDLQPCKTCGRGGFKVDDLAPEQFAQLLAAVRSVVAARPIPVPIPDAPAVPVPIPPPPAVEHDMADIPRLLPENPRLLCDPPFADLFVLYLYRGKLAEVKKTLLSLLTKARARGRFAARVLGVRVEEQGTVYWEGGCPEEREETPLEPLKTPLALIAHRHKVTVKTIENQLSQAAALLGRPKRKRKKAKEKKD